MVRDWALATAAIQPAQDLATVAPAWGLVSAPQATLCRYSLWHEPKAELSEKSLTGVAGKQAATKVPVVRNKLPAFWQPANVAAIYSSSTKSTEG